MSETQPKWQVDATRGLFGRYRMTCPQCGYSFTSNRIEARSRCDYCGTVFSDRDRFYRINAGGKKIEEMKGA